MTDSNNNNNNNITNNTSDNTPLPNDGSDDDIIKGDQFSESGDESP